MVSFYIQLIVIDQYFKKRIISICNIVNKTFDGLYILHFIIHYIKKKKKSCSESTIHKSNHFILLFQPYPVNLRFSFIVVPDTFES